MTEGTRKKSTAARPSVAERRERLYGVRRDLARIGLKDGIDLNDLAMGRGTAKQTQKARHYVLWLVRRRAGNVREMIRVACEIDPGCRLAFAERAVELGEEICARQSEAWGEALDGSDSRIRPVLPLTLANWRLLRMERRAERIIERASVRTRSAL